MSGRLITIDDIDTFRKVRDFPATGVTAQLQQAVRGLDEREELEPFLRAILTDTSDTPHGPSEMADILTHKLSVKKSAGLAAFIIKGKSYPTVRPKHVAHQIYRLEKIHGLRFAILAAPGTVLDPAKEHFCATAERLGCYYTVFDVVDLARLFVAYGFLCPRDARRVAAGRCRCGYSPEYRILNVLQDDSLRELENAHKLGQAAGLVVLPPGSGKTRIAAEDANRFNATRVLYVAHTHEILDVAESEFSAVFGASAATRHTRGSTLSRPSRVNIATIQLLQRHLNKIKPDRFDYLVVDEFHHAAARSYRRLLSSVSPRFLLGLTATPFRGDRQDIVELCGGNVLVNFELRTGIETGILAPYHYYGCFDDVDYSNIRHNGIRYDIRDLERALLVPERDSAIIQQWRTYAEGKPTIAFCCSHRHAHRFAQSLQRQGIAASVYLSHTPWGERRELIQQHQQGELNVLCVVDVLNEGADFPYVDCLLFLRPTESKRIFFQQLGRGLRRYVGKSHCTVIDFIGNFKNAYRLPEYHGLRPIEDDDPAVSVTRIRRAKDLLNLPLGCEVHFDAKVIDLFAQQVLDPRSRHSAQHRPHPTVSVCQACPRAGPQANKARRETKSPTRRSVLQPSLRKLAPV